MSTVTRTAGVAGTFTATFTQAPVQPPTVTIYSDPARTVVVVATAPMVATDNATAWTASYPETLPAGTFYLVFSAVYTLGQPAVLDQDDTLVLTAPGVGLTASLVTVDELNLLLEEDVPVAEAPRAEFRIANVSAIFRQIAGQEWPDGAPEAVKAVALDVIARMWRNPNGFVSETIGSYSYRLPDGSSLSLTADERAVLVGFKPARPNAGLWSQSLTRDDPAADTEWVPVEGALHPFPWYAK